MTLALAQTLVLVDAAFSNRAMLWWGAGHDLGLATGGVKVTSTVYLDVMPVSYVLAFAGVLLFGTRVADLVGRKRMLVIGLAGFAVAAALGGAAPSSTAWITGRALQGAFAALISSSVPALLSTSFTDPGERRRAFGIHTAIAGGGPALGLLAFWLFPVGPNWRWCLFAAALLAVAATAGAAALVHDRPGRAGLRLDGPGVLLGAAGIIGIGGAVPYFEGHALLVPVAGALLAAFVWRQTRTAGALAPPPGPGAPRGHLLATALVNVAVAALLMAVGHLRF